MEPLKVNNLNLLKALKNHTDGEIAYVQDIEKYYMYKDNDWIPVEGKMSDTGFKVDLYSLNKQLMSQCKPLSEEELKNQKQNFDEWVNNATHYYLLYGKELGYFTMFKATSLKWDNLFDILIECLYNVGDVISFNETEDKMAYEIWVKVEDEATCLYLFDYDRGIVEV